jgi:hypothetical protein
VGALLAGLLPAIFPLSLGYQASDTAAVVAAAAIAAGAATVIVPLAFASAGAGSIGRRSTTEGLLLLSAALLSVGAAAIHLAVAKMHFDEYTLFGVFFVASGVAQLAWALWLVLRADRRLLLPGAVGNALIVTLWAVSRTAGLPIGPEHWKPESVGFADMTASAFEVVLAICCLALLARRPRRLTAARPALIAITLSIAALTTLGLLSAMGVASSLITPSA